MKYFIGLFIFLFSNILLAQNCLDDWEHKPSVAVERYAKEVASLKLEALKSTEEFLLSFIRVSETKTGNSHYAFQLAHLDYDKLAGHRISKALIEQQEVIDFIEMLEQFIQNSELKKGESNTTYSYMTMNGLQLYGYYSDSGWHTYIVFEHYNNVRVSITYTEMKTILDLMANANDKAKSGKFLEI